jgi:hypothetical protein
MIDIPQDVRVRVAAKLYSVVNRDDSFRLADAIIPLTQLPIAPATEEELERFTLVYLNHKGSGKESREAAINDLISRRNSPPPQVDPRVEKILKAQHDFRVLYFSEAHKPMTTDSDTAEAEAILAALDAMKEKG